MRADSDPARGLERRDVIEADGNDLVVSVSNIGADTVAEHIPPTVLPGNPRRLLGSSDSAEEFGRAHPE
jgi:hypothetical protein